MHQPVRLNAQRVAIQIAFQRALVVVNTHVAMIVHLHVKLAVKLSVQQDALVHVKMGAMETAKVIAKLPAPSSVKKVVLIHVQANV